MKMKTGLEEKYKEYQEANAGDPYSHRCVTYGEMWAAYMEAELSLKPDMSDDEFGVMAGKTGNEADTDGITGYMYGAAVSALAHFWEYGDRLRRWHNNRFGVTEEKAKGGTVNPAIITIEERP
jgi:hypothetical protein